VDFFSPNQRSKKRFTKDKSLRVTREAFDVFIPSTLILFFPSFYLTLETQKEKWGFPLSHGDGKKQNKEI
jgi:hypothetical protein